MRRRLLTDDRGSATVWVLALAAVLAACGAAVVLVGAAVVARHRATTAADLAAVAAAGRAVVGDEDPCATAARVAVANHAVVESCQVRPGALTEVRVRVTVRLGPMGSGAARARARAGRVLPGEDATGRRWPETSDQ